MTTKNKKAALVGFGVLALFMIPNKSNASNSTGIAPPNGSPVGTEGSLNESFLGLVSYPVGVRNNNLGNIKINSSNNWTGKIPLSQNTNGTFEQFRSLAEGTRAMIKLLKNYIVRDNRNTLKKIIQYWDLGNPAYTSFLVNETGFSENQILQGDKQTLKKLAQAIVYFEVGSYFLTDARFEVGYSLL